MKKIKDFFYNCNDIIVVCVIIILAGLLVYWRVGIIIDYPRVLADEISTRTKASTEISDPSAKGSTDEKLPPANDEKPKNPKNPDNLPSTIWEGGKLKSNMQVTVSEGSAEEAVQALVDAGLFSSFDDYADKCRENDIDPGWIQASTYSFEKGITQNDIILIVTARYSN
jgi:hypothetical protein